MKVGSSGTADTTLRSLAVISLLTGLALSSAREARAITQEPGGRFRVLVAPLESKALHDNFGEDVAKAIRDRLEDFTTHAPIAENEFKRAMKRYEVRREDLNAIKARQLANLMGAQVVFWGAVVQQGAGYAVNAKFIDVKTGDEVAVPSVTVTGRDNDQVKKVAEAAIGAFDEQVKFVRARQFCAEYVGSQQPDNAIRNCNEALEINPNSVDALFNKALAFRLKYENGGDEPIGTNGWADSAIVYFERVLENDPGRRPAMENLAWLNTRIGNAERATELYRQYLELDPGNVAVRLKVAYDIAQAGLMAEAIEIIQEGLEYAENDTTLLQQLGDYSLQYSSTDSSYIDVALNAYEKVLELKGAQTDLSVVENVIATYTRANRLDDAIRVAERALETNTESARLWSLYADALARQNRFTEAAAAMDRVIALDASYQHAFLRRGRFKLQAGEAEAGMADLRQAIESATSTEQDVYNLLWGEAINTRNNQNSSRRFIDALPLFERAAQFAPADQRQLLHFWWAYTHYQRGEQLADPQDAGIDPLRQALSNFQAALNHFNQAGQVRPEVPQLKDACQKWILNVEARIKQLSR